MGSFANVLRGVNLEDIKLGSNFWFIKKLGHGP